MAVTIMINIMPDKQNRHDSEKAEGSCDKLMFNRLNVNTARAMQEACLPMIPQNVTY